MRLRSNIESLRPESGLGAVTGTSAGAAGETEEVEVT